MTLEPGLTPLPEFSWELGAIPGTSDGLRYTRIGTDGDDGLDDLGELEDDDYDLGLDGTSPGLQRINARPVSIQLWLNGHLADGDPAANLAAELNQLRRVLSPLPNRTALRPLRWRRPGEYAKRLQVRPYGRPLVMPGDRRRLLDLSAPVTIRLSAPEPIVVSDAYESVTFTAGQVHDIENLGSLTAVQPLAWWITSAVPVAIEHLDYPEEYIRFPVGPVTTTRALAINAPGAYGVCFGRSSNPFPDWPLLRPGINRIKASAPCTFNWRHTS